MIHMGILVSKRKKNIIALHTVKAFACSLFYKSVRGQVNISNVSVKMATTTRFYSLLVHMLDL